MLKLQQLNTLQNLKGKVELLGIQELSSSSVKYRIVVPTVAMEHFSVERQIRKELKVKLDKAKIKIDETSYTLIPNIISYLFLIIVTKSIKCSK